MIQAQLEHPSPDGGRTVFVTWIPKDLKTREGDQVTAAKDPTLWTVATQYSLIAELETVPYGWKLVSEKQSPGQRTTSDIRNS
jgi:hypothetical protein